MIEAYAGTGKTTTLVDWVAPNLDPRVPALALAFNVKIKADLEGRFPPHFKVMTLNGLGHQAWGRKLGKACQVDPRKLGKIVTSEGRAYGLTREQWQDTVDVVTAAMQAGLVPGGQGLVKDLPSVWEALAEDCGASSHDKMLQFYREVLLKSISEGMKGLISFDDQVYLPTLFGGQFPSYRVVLVDEAQDLSPLNHEQIRRTATDRLIVVGDSRQAIYAFRGASSDSMARLRGLREQWSVRSLSLTFRCPPEIVERQQRHAPGYRSNKASGTGEVRDLKGTWGWADVAGEDVAILCRNNAPLLALAFKLLRQGVAPVVLGRDIGKGLVKLSKEIAKDDQTTGADLRGRIAGWLGAQRSLAVANGEEEKIDGLEDKAQSLLAVLDSLSPRATAGQLRVAIEALFAKETGRVTLSSIHKSKGLEWSSVVVLDPWRIPSKFSLRAADRGDRGPLGQELNLRYVAETRTKSQLFLASLSDFL